MHGGPFVYASLRMARQDVKNTFKYTNENWDSVMQLKDLCFVLCSDRTPKSLLLIFVEEGKCNCYTKR